MGLKGGTPRNPEPRSAADYDDRTTAAVKSVLVEIGQVLGGFRSKFVVVGGVVPLLLLDAEDMPHIGTVDVDLNLDPEALGGGEYAELVGALIEQGYAQDERRAKFQLVRKVQPEDSGKPISVVIDFLMPREACIEKNRAPLISDFAVQRADGAKLALRFFEMVDINGPMPEGGINSVRLAVASIPAFLVMKGFALGNRLKTKDAYDIYYCIRNYPGGFGVLAEACRPLLEHEDARSSHATINEKFETADSFGPTSVRKFVAGTRALQGRTPGQWQQDAFGQINVWLHALGLRHGG